MDWVRLRHGNGSWVRVRVSIPHLAPPYILHAKERAPQKAIMRNRLDMDSDPLIRLMVTVNWTFPLDLDHMEALHMHALASAAASAAPAAPPPASAVSATSSALDLLHIAGRTEPLLVVSGHGAAAAAAGSAVIGAGPGSPSPSPAPAGAGGAVPGIWLDNRSVHMPVVGAPGGFDSLSSVGQPSSPPERPLRPSKSSPPGSPGSTLQQAQSRLFDMSILDDSTPLGGWEHHHPAGAPASATAAAAAGKRPATRGGAGAGKHTSAPASTSPHARPSTSSSAPRRPHHVPTRTTLILDPLSGTPLTTAPAMTAGGARPAATRGGRLGGGTSPHPLVASDFARANRARNASRPSTTPNPQFSSSFMGVEDAARSTSTKAKTKKRLTGRRGEGITARDAQPHGNGHAALRSYPDHITHHRQDLSPLMQRDTRLRRRGRAARPHTSDGRAMVAAVTAAEAEIRRVRRQQQPAPPGRPGRQDPRHRTMNAKGQATLTLSASNKGAGVVNRWNIDDIVWGVRADAAGVDWRGAGRQADTFAGGPALPPWQVSSCSSLGIADWYAKSLRGTETPAVLASKVDRVRRPHTSGGGQVRRLQKLRGARVKAAHARDGKIVRIVPPRQVRVHGGLPGAELRRRRELRRAAERERNEQFATMRAANAATTGWRHAAGDGNDPVDLDYDDETRLFVYDDDGGSEVGEDDDDDTGGVGSAFLSSVAAGSSSGSLIMEGVPPPARPRFKRDPSATAKRACLLEHTLQQRQQKRQQQLRGQRGGGRRPEWGRNDPWKQRRAVQAARSARHQRRLLLAGGGGVRLGSGSVFHRASHLQVHGGSTGAGRRRRAPGSLW